MALWGKKKAWWEGWETEVERILKEGGANYRLDAFMERFERERDVEPPEEWQEVLSAFFDNLISELPPAACCILAFKAGQVWQKYQEELGG